MLHVHRAERADGLVAALRELLAEPLADPFAPEVVAVPTRGMERWLTQRLSAGLGARRAAATACARTSTSRRRGGWSATRCAAASGIDPERDPWLPERAVWPLLEVVDECLGRAVAGGRWPRTSATADGARAAFARRPPPRRPVRPLRAAPAGACVRGVGRPAAGRRAGRPSCGGGCAQRIARARPGRAAASRACARLRDDAGARRPARRGSRCSASRACRRATSRVLRALRRRTATSTCSCCTRRRRCGSGSRGHAPRSSAAPTTRPPPAREPAARLVGPRRARAAARARRRTHVDHHHPVEHRRRHAAGADPGRRARGPRAARRRRRRAPAARPGDRSVAGPRLPRPRPPGRGRCATRSCTCSPTTRRSSRAT